MMLSEKYSVAGIPVLVTRKKVKNLSLRFSEDGKTLRLTVPIFATEHDIDSMLKKCEAWVIRNAVRARSRSDDEDKRFDSGDTLWLWGRGYTVKRMAGEKYKLETGENTALLYAPENADGEDVRAFLREWYRDQLRKKAPEYLTKLENRTGLHPSSWQGKAMKTRWGSCNVKTGRIWLSVYLAQKDEKCLEYVILHELCHLKHPDHGSGFKAMLGEYMPDWKNRKKLLGSNETDFL